MTLRVTGTGILMKRGPDIEKYQSFVWSYILFIERYGYPLLLFNGKCCHSRDEKFCKWMCHMLLL